MLFYDLFKLFADKSILFYDPYKLINETIELYFQTFFDFGH